MVDFHTHILPGIDDGATSYEESIEMLSLMIQNGVKVAVATPHFDFENDDVEYFLKKRSEAMTVLKETILSSNMKIEVFSGAELMFNTNLNNYNLDNLVIEGTDYLLIELSTRRNDPTLEHTLSAIIANGYIPILAHIERYPYLIENSERLVKLIELGVLMQINASSLQKKRKYPFIDALIRNNLVHVVCSDAHDMTKRKPNLKLSDLKIDFLEIQSKIISNIIVSVAKPRKMRKIFRNFI